MKEYLRAKVEQRAPEVTIEKRGKPAPQVINIMDAFKKSVQAKGRIKVRNARTCVVAVGAEADEKPRRDQTPSVALRGDG